MAIKLRVISDHYRELGEDRSRVFGVNGGSVGRAADNDWVLPDPRRIVSGHHCDIEYRGGTYWLRDTSTNGVFVNESGAPVSGTGPVELKDGDRLRIGDYDILVSVDDRIDFLPSAGDEDSTSKHLDRDLGANLDLGSLLQPRDGVPESGSTSVRNAFGIKIQKELSSATSVMEPEEEPPPPAPQTMPSDWAIRTRPISRQELDEAVERRKSRMVDRERSAAFHQQAASWADLQSAVQAFCRGAGIDVTKLSPEAQSMLPLLAGQLLREAVVGITDVLQAHSNSGLAAGSGKGAVSTGPGVGSNPLRSSTSAEQALQRLFDAPTRSYARPVEALREALQDLKEHDAAIDSGVRAGLRAVLEQLAPSNVADQFESGRARALPPGQDPRPRYWEHFAEFYRVLTQGMPEGGLPYPFVEQFRRAYEEARAASRVRRRVRENGSSD